MLMGGNYQDDGGETQEETKFDHNSYNMPIDYILLGSMAESDRETVRTKSHRFGHGDVDSQF